MSGFNKITSFVLGLIVVLVFLLVFGSRINLSDKLVALRDKNATPTPTPAVVQTPKKGFFESLFGTKTTPTPTPTIAVASNQTSDQERASAPTPKNIPNTGPALLFPIAISAFGSGLYLRRKK